MATTLRRLFWVSVIGGGGYAGWRYWQQRSSSDTRPAPEWPPLDPPSNEQIATTVPSAVPMTAATTPSALDRPAVDEHPVESAPADSSFHSGSTVADDADPRNAPAGDAPRWVAPADGNCPAGYPVKANDNSGIYHRQGGRFYDRTIPERCYATPEDAEADGYRAAKT